MYIVDIWTIDSTVPAGSITYRSGIPIIVGSWIHCLVGKRSVWGIVGSCVHARNAKLQIKSATFQTKELKPLQLLPGLSPSILATLSTHYPPVIPPTDIVHTLFSSIWALSGVYPQSATSAKIILKQGDLQQLTKDPEITRKNTIWICPHELSARDLFQQLQRLHIHTVSIVRPPSQKTLHSIATTQPCHIVCTPPLALPWIPDIKTCIITEFSNMHYNQKIKNVHHINRSEILLHTWKHMAPLVIVHDWILPFGYIANTEKNPMEYTIPPGLTIYQAQASLKKTPLSVDTIIETILDATHRIFRQTPTARILIIAKSKYEGSGIACFYCGWRGVCPNCKTLLITDQNGSGPTVFKCTQCTHTIIAYDRCPNCHGPSLSIMSVGTKKLIRAFADHFSDTPLHNMTRDNMNTERIIIQMKRILRTNESSIVCTTANSAYSVPLGYFTHCIILPFSWWFGPDSNGMETALRSLLRLTIHIPKVYIPPDVAGTTFLTSTIPESWESVARTDILARKRFDPDSLINPFDPAE